jgi:hypothetical protein
VNGDDAEIEKLELQIMAWMRQGYYGGRDDHFRRFVELAPGRAASAAKYCHEIYVMNQCDAMCLLTVYSREQHEEFCDDALRAARVRDELVKAGAAQPGPKACDLHGRVL